MGQAKRKQARQAEAAEPATAATDGMTLTEMRDAYQQLQQGLVSLRREVAQQEGAVLFLGQMIQRCEGKAAAPVEPDVEPDEAGEDGE